MGVKIKKRIFGKNLEKLNFALMIEVMENFENEIWLKTYVSPYYEVSNFGRVRRVEGYVTNKKNVQRFYPSRLMNLRYNEHGYLILDLRVQTGRRVTPKVHQLVYHSFNNSFPASGMCVDHIDGDKTNNNLSNLQFITQQENVLKGKIVTMKKSGLPLYINLDYGKFRVSRIISKKYINFGRYDKLEDAMIRVEELMKCNWEK